MYVYSQARAYEEEGGKEHKVVKQAESPTCTKNRGAETFQKFALHIHSALVL